MGNIAIITEDQKDLLINKKYDGVMYFNPTKDNNDNWFVSEEEIRACTTKGFEFLNELKLIPYSPSEYD